MAMEAYVLPILEFMAEKTSFLIPVYQRNYDWTEVHCETLWKNLVKSYKTKCSRPHFFGFIVSDNSDERGNMVIVDGQQRLTTMSILMLAIRNKIKELKSFNPGLVLPDEKAIDSVCWEYNAVQKLKLKLLPKKAEAYECLAFGRNCDAFKKTNIYKNYDYFYNQLTAENINDIYNACKNLQVVSVVLGSKSDTPQSVFESLNATGLDLGESDKVCNYILSGVPYAQQQHLYEKFWKKIEENVALNEATGPNADRTKKYVQAFLHYKLNEPINDKAIYTEFKKYKESSGQDVNDILQDMLYMSDIYGKIKREQIGTVAIDQKIGELLRIAKPEPLMPLFMYIIANYYADKSSISETMNMLHIIETYIVRCGVMGESVKSRDKMLFLNLKIEEEFAKGRARPKILMQLINNISGKKACPSDAILPNGLLYGHWCKKDSKLCEHILKSIEKYSSKMHGVLPKGLRVEYIMPNTLTQTWKKDLGSDWESIHSKYIDTMGNVTLVEYDKKYSREGFVSKKKLASGGFDNSGLFLNEYMRTIDAWNEDHIVNRAKLLASRFFKIWSTQVFDGPKPVEKPNSVVLDNQNIDVIIKNRQPISIELMGRPIYGLDNWRKLYIEIMKQLYSNWVYTQKMQIAFNNGNRAPFRDIISNIDEAPGENRWFQILLPDNVVYFNLNKGSKELVAAIRKWFDYLGISESDLLIYLK